MVGGISLIWAIPSYTYVTDGILSLGTGGEGKTMGLAPYGDGYEPVLDLDTELDGVKNDFSHFVRRQPMSDIVNHLPNPERLYPFRQEYRRASTKEELLEPYFARAAFDIQKETEQVLTHLARELYDRTHARYLCIAGGLGLNSVSNKIILDKGGFEDIFIFPACSDSGVPFGLAVWGYYNLEENRCIPKKQLFFTNAYTGRTYDDNHILETFRRYGLKYRQMNLGEIARDLADGKIVGWFQGGSEYGPRALGNRSILADPRRADIKDHLNLKVKHREPFRPYAPAVLEEYVSEYFELDRQSPYMLLIAKVKKPDVIPAVTHVDQTARVQSVNQRDNGIFYDLIQEFHKITGVPVLLNTSFNDAGEPIVETPEDAIISFLFTEMDQLVIGSFVLDAKDNQHVDVAGMARDRTGLIENKRNTYLEWFCPGYSEDERDCYIAETNKIAEWHTKYRSLYELEKKTREWVENKKRIVIVGTDDHTLLLSQYVNEFINVEIVGYIPYRKRFDAGPGERPQYPELGMEELHSCRYDEVLVSSWEYQFDILDELESYALEKPVYPIYDNASRSFMDVLKDRLPVFSKSIYAGVLTKTEGQP